MYGASHSGYHFPLQPPSEYHDLHHKAFNVNFGSDKFLDWLHGTYAKTYQAHQHERDIYTTAIDTIKEVVARTKKTN